jgi:hypothetical protein
VRAKSVTRIPRCVAAVTTCRCSAGESRSAMTRICFTPVSVRDMLARYTPGVYFPRLLRQTQRPMRDRISLGRPRQVALGAGDFLPANVAAAAHRAWAEAHGGEAPLGARAVRDIFRTSAVVMPIETGSAGWAQMSGPGAFYDGGPVTHVFSSNAALDAYVAVQAARKAHPNTTAPARAGRAAKRAAARLPPAGTVLNSPAPGWGLGGQPLAVAIVGNVVVSDLSPPIEPEEPVSVAVPRLRQVCRGEAEGDREEPERQVRVPGEGHEDR